MVGKPETALDHAPVPLGAKEVSPVRKGWDFGIVVNGSAGGAALLAGTGEHYLSTITTTERLGNYLEIFSELEQRTAKHPAWLRALREDAFARFCKTGFPTTRDEDWRFTNVNAIANRSFLLAQAAHHRITSAHLQQFQIPGAACRLVFVNGKFAPALSDVSALPPNVKVCSLANELAQNPGALE